MYRNLCELVFTPCGKCPKVRLHFYSTWRPPLSCLATQMGLSENPEPSAFKENGLLAGHAPRRQTRGEFSLSPFSPALIINQDFILATLSLMSIILNQIKSLRLCDFIASFPSGVSRNSMTISFGPPKSTHSISPQTLYSD